MATASKPEPLAVLDQMFNEVVCVNRQPYRHQLNKLTAFQLIQTGKAFKATRLEGSKNISAVGGTVQSKVPDIMVTYHDALNDIESEIVCVPTLLHLSFYSQASLVD